MWQKTRLARLTKLTKLTRLARIGNRKVGRIAHDRQDRQSAHDGVGEHARGLQNWTRLAKLTKVCESMSLLVTVLRRQICKLLTRLARLLTRPVEGSRVAPAAHG